MRNGCIIGLAACAMVLLLVAMSFVLVVISAGGSASGTLASGRRLQVNSDSIWLSCQYSGDTATIRTGGKTIVVAPTALLIDGRPVAPLEASSKNIVVTANRGRITLVADGAEVITSRD